MEGNSCCETYLQRNRTCTLTPFSLSWRVVICSRRRRLPNRRRHVHECRCRGSSFPGTYYGRIHQESSSRNDASSFSTIALQGTVVSGFFFLARKPPVTSKTHRRDSEKKYTEPKQKHQWHDSCHVCSTTKHTQKWHRWRSIGAWMKSQTTAVAAMNAVPSTQRERENTQKL